MYWKYIYEIWVCINIIVYIFMCEYTYMLYTCILLYIRLLYSLIQEACKSSYEPPFWPLKSINHSKYFSQLKNYYLCVHLSWQKIQYAIAVSKSQNSWGWRVPLEVIWSNPSAQAGPSRGTCSSQFGISMCLLTCMVNNERAKDLSCHFCYLFLCSNYTHRKFTQNLLKFC